MTIELSTNPHSSKVTPSPQEKKERFGTRWEFLRTSWKTLPEREKLLSRDFRYVAWVLSQLVHNMREIKKNGYEGKTLVTRHRSESFSLDHEGVCYLSFEESRKYITTIQDNSLFQQGIPYSTEGNLHMFVIGIDDTENVKMFVRAPKYVVKPNEKRIHHSSFFAGAPIISAGEFRTTLSGRIEEITDRSGHYRPELKHFLEGLAALKKEFYTDLSTIKIKVHFSKTIESGVEHGGHLYFNNGQQFLLTEGQRIPDKVSSLQPFFTNAKKRKVTEQGYIEAVKDHRGITTALRNIWPEEEIVSINTPSYNLSEKEKDDICLAASINSLMVYRSRGLNLKNIFYTHIWQSGEADYDAEEFLNSHGKTSPKRELKQTTEKPSGYQLSPYEQTSDYQIEGYLE